MAIWIVYEIDTEVELKSNFEWTQVLACTRTSWKAFATENFLSLAEKLRS
jgi:hypothetical protein